MNSVSRRQFVQSMGVAGLGLLVGCTLPAASPPPPSRVPRVGVMTAWPANLPRAVAFREAFEAGLRDLGYVQGQNLSLELRYAEDQLDRLPSLAAELASLPVDIMVVQGDAAITAARQASGAIPIVFALNSAPVETGVIASLVRPGGNVTGLSEMTPTLSGKRLELLREAVPGLARTGVLWSPQSPGPALQFKETERAATALGLELLPLPVRGPEDIEGAFEAAAQGRAEALVVLQGAVIIPHAARIVELATRGRLTAMYVERLWMEAGGLMSYGANVADMWRRAATYVDKILKGAKPAELPVEQPTTFDFMINLKTAQALGLTIPQSVLLQATEVIQ